VRSRLGATLCFVALAASAAGAQTPPPAIPPPVAGPTFAPAAPPTLPATPATTAVPSAAPANATTAAPNGIATPTTPPTVAPTPAFIQYTAQLLDVVPGYVYFTTGDVFPTVEPLRVIDADTGLPTSKTPAVKMFARATFDPVSHKIIELAITRRRLPTSTSEAQVVEFAIPATNGDKAPELAGPAITGKQVAVVFEVTVPPTTSLTDEIYISTDVSQWNPQAIRLDRTDAYRYRAIRYFASGTKFAYRVTRGTWRGSRFTIGRTKIRPRKARARIRSRPRTTAARSPAAPRAASSCRRFRRRRRRRTGERRTAAHRVRRASLFGRDVRRG
jgi:hypothetical protein